MANRPRSKARDRERYNRRQREGDCDGLQRVGILRPSNAAWTATSAASSTAFFFAPASRADLPSDRTVPDPCLPPGPRRARHRALPSFSLARERIDPSKETTGPFPRSALATPRARGAERPLTEASGGGRHSGPIRLSDTRKRPSNLWATGFLWTTHGTGGLLQGLPRLTVDACRATALCLFAERLLVLPDCLAFLSEHLSSYIDSV